MTPDEAGTTIETVEVDERLALVQEVCTAIAGRDVLRIKAVAHNGVEMRMPFEPRPKQCPSSRRVRHSTTPTQSTFYRKMPVL
jgi:hypothetical protein